MLAIYLAFLIPPAASWAESPACPAHFAQLAPKEHIALRYDAPYEEYARAIGQLGRDTKPGTVLDFGQGDSFVFAKFLGEGATTTIVKTADGKVLRIPKRTPGAYPGTDLGGFLRLQKELEDAVVPVVTVDRAASRPPRFLVVAEEHVVGDLGHILKPGAAGLDEAARAKALERLDDFARRTWAFNFIGDFNETQLVYDGKDWKLLDVGMRNIPIHNHHETKNLFSSRASEDGTLSFVPPALEKRLSRVINDERAKRFAAGDWRDETPYFERSGVKDGGLIASDQDLDLTNGTLQVSEKFFTKRGDKKLSAWSDGPARLRIKGLATLGDKSAVYEAEINGKEALVEVRLSIDGKGDLFAGKVPLLKASGYGKDDAVVVGPDYVVVLK